MSDADQPAEERFGLPSQDVPPDHRSGFVALAGRPNVGKSTLLNRWLGERLAPVSPKPQTTRSRLLGILTRSDAQVMFVDTPGIHEPRTRLGVAMVAAARRAIADADVTVWLVDAAERPNAADRHIAEFLASLREARPAVLALNKIDAVTPDILQQRREDYAQLGEFAAVEAISALEGTGCDDLLQRVVGMLPYGPRYYAEDQLTDQQERFVVAELVREQMLNLLEQEVPHASAVVVHEFKERPNGTVYIAANIYTERETQKAIVIGKNGAMLKRIGAAAREQIEAFLGRPVYLELWVKVLKNWRRDENLLRRLGYGRGGE